MGLYEIYPDCRDRRERPVAYDGSSSGTVGDVSYE